MPLIATDCHHPSGEPLEGHAALDTAPPNGADPALNTAQDGLDTAPQGGADLVPVTAHMPDTAPDTPAAAPTRGGVRAPDTTFDAVAALSGTQWQSPVEAAAACSQSMDALAASLRREEAEAARQALAFTATWVPPPDVSGPSNAVRVLWSPSASICFLPIPSYPFDSLPIPSRCPIPLRIPSNSFPAQALSSSTPSTASNCL